MPRVVICVDPAHVESAVFSTLFSAKSLFRFARVTSSHAPDPLECLPRTRPVAVAFTNFAKATELSDIVLVLIAQVVDPSQCKYPAVLPGLASLASVIAASAMFAVAICVAVDPHVPEAIVPRVVIPPEPGQEEEMAVVIA